MILLAQNLNVYNFVYIRTSAFSTWSLFQKFNSEQLGMTGQCSLNLMLYYGNQNFNGQVFAKLEYSCFNE